MNPLADELSLPALLRGARGAFRAVIRAALQEGGYDDLPPNGPFVVGAIARADVPLADVIRHLGASKQAAGQLVDTLVLRGYLERTTDPADRRRLVVSLTERGAGAAAAVRRAVDAIESELTDALGDGAVRSARQVLAWLVRHEDPA